MMAERTALSIVAQNQLPPVYDVLLGNLVSWSRYIHHLSELAAYPDLPVYCFSNVDFVECCLLVCWAGLLDEFYWTKPLKNEAFKFKLWTAMPKIFLCLLPTGFEPKPPRLQISSLYHWIPPPSTYLLTYIHSLPLQPFFMITA